MVSKVVMPSRLPAPGHRVDYLPGSRRASTGGLASPHEDRADRGRPAPPLAPERPPQPARPGVGQRGVGAAPELRGDRPGPGEPVAAAAPRRAPGDAAAGAQRA